MMAVVEDDTELRDLIMEQFAQENYSLFPVTGVDALTLLAQDVSLNR